MCMGISFTSKETQFSLLSFELSAIVSVIHVYTLL